MPAMISVAQLNAYVKSLLEADLNLNNLFVCGEISNFTNHYRTGHFYFTLKDETSAVKAVMFRSSAQRIKFMPQDGMKVLVRCSVSLFERDGAYQLYVEDMQPDGVGALNLAFEQLKQKLEKAGMFDPSHKKPIPEYPDSIAVVTSPTGAAVQDIFNVLSRRYPLARIILAPVQVQGSSAAPQIAAAIDEINRKRCADIIICGRGGGSIEDLWAFNDENVACSIYNSDIPVISAVGHETDSTIADFVADLRAPTPSAAAELAVPDWRSVLSMVDSLALDAGKAVNRKISSCSSLCDAYKFKLAALRPDRQLESMRSTLDSLSLRLNNCAFNAVDSNREALALTCVKLHALSPLKVLARGYSIVRDSEGSVVTDAANLKSGDRLSLRFSNGEAVCTVN